MLYLWVATIFGYSDPLDALRGVELKNKFFKIGGFGNSFANFNVSLFGYLAYIYLPLLLIPLYKLHDDTSYSSTKIRLTFAYIVMFFSLLLLQSVVFDYGLIGNFIKDGIISYVGISFGIFLVLLIALIFFTASIAMISSETMPFVALYMGRTFRIVFSTFKGNAIEYCKKFFQKMRSLYTDLNLDYIQRANKRMLYLEYSEVITITNNADSFDIDLIETPLDESTKSYNINNINPNDSGLMNTTQQEATAIDTESNNTSQHITSDSLWLIKKGVTSPKSYIDPSLLDTSVSIPHVSKTSIPKEKPGFTYSKDSDLSTSIDSVDITLQKFIKPSIHIPSFSSLPTIKPKTIDLSMHPNVSNSFKESNESNNDITLKTIKDNSQDSNNSDKKTAVDIPSFVSENILHKTNNTANIQTASFTLKEIKTSDTNSLSYDASIKGTSHVLVTKDTCPINAVIDKDPIEVLDHAKQKEDIKEKDPHITKNTEYTLNNDKQIKQAQPTANLVSEDTRLNSQISSTAILTPNADSNTPIPAIEITNENHNNQLNNTNTTKDLHTYTTKEHITATTDIQDPPYKYEDIEITQIVTEELTDSIKTYNGYQQITEPTNNYTHQESPYNAILEGTELVQEEINPIAITPTFSNTDIKHDISNKQPLESNTDNKTPPQRPLASINKNTGNTIHTHNTWEYPPLALPPMNATSQIQPMIDSNTDIHYKQVDNAYITETTTPTYNNDAIESSHKPTPIISHNENIDSIPIIKETINIDNVKSLPDISNADSEATDTYYIKPPLELLQQHTPELHIDDQEIDNKIDNLLAKLRVFKIKGDIINVSSGPVVTTFEFRPEPDVKVNKVLSLQDDLAMALKAKSIRIQAPIPGKDVMGIEIPNNKVSTIYLREVLEKSVLSSQKDSLTIALGKDIIGESVSANLATLPHLLVAGTTGSGKSVGVNAMILSLLYNKSPSDLRLMMIDPKQVEFAPYEDLPHLITPIINSPGKAIQALLAATAEMDKRYKIISDAKVKNILSYNQKSSEKMPFFVIIIDELADLIMTGGKDAEVPIARIAQMGRAAGMHLIIATQRSSTNIVTGTIKANLPSRISYRVGNRIDSKVILDDSGAERLLGNGDGLFTASQGLKRIHAPWVSEQEIDKVVSFIKSQMGPQYDESFLNEDKSKINVEKAFAESGTLIDEAKDIMLKDNKTSISYIQRKLGIGYNKAASIVEALEKEGFLSAPNSRGERSIIDE